MNEKQNSLFTIYRYYAKGDGEEISEQFIDTDRRGLRGDLVDDFGTTYLLSNGEVDKFIEGETSSIYLDSDDPDWRSPTGFRVVVEAKEERLEKLKENYDKEVSRVKDLFEENVE